MMNLRHYSNQGEMQMYNIELVSAEDTTSKDYENTVILAKEKES